MIKSLLVSAAAIGAVAVGVSWATDAQASCSGNGCKYFQYSVEQGCAYLKNTHTNRRLRAVGKRAIPKYVFYVPPNSKVPAKAMGGCMGGWYKNYEVKIDG